MRHSSKLGAAAAVAALALSGFGAAAAQATPGLVVSSPVIEGEQYTVEGRDCPATWSDGAGGPILDFVAMDVHFREGGEASWPGEPGVITSTDSGWIYTGTATRPDTYSVTQVCDYAAYAGELTERVFVDFGSLVVEADPNSGGGDNGGGDNGNGGNNGGNTGWPALPAEPAPGAPNGGVSPLSIDMGNPSNPLAFVILPSGYSGQTVYGTLFSTPQSLGSAVVTASNTAQFALPVKIEAGVHKLVVQRADGTVIGYAEFVFGPSGWQLVKQSAGAKLARTGGEALTGAAIAGAAALMLGAGLVLANRRRGAVQ